jgi:predicted RNA-binding protein with PIN domain
MRYLIDGYNLLYKLGLLAHEHGPRGLEHARQRLLDRLANSAGHEANSITIVFDGRGAPEGLRDQAEYRSLHVRYAHEDTADGLIEELLHGESAPRGLTVVSDDRRVREAARRRGCEVVACLDVFDELGRVTPERPGAQQAAPDAPLRPERLSPEETQRWLKEFGEAGLTDPPDDIRPL